jgi:hypothetical protein
MTIETPSHAARDYVTSKSGVRVTVHKSVRNNWKTTEHRDGRANVVIMHDNRQAALQYARSVE